MIDCTHAGVARELRGGCGHGISWPDSAETPAPGQARFGKTATLRRARAFVCVLAYPISCVKEPARCPARGGWPHPPAFAAQHVAVHVHDQHLFVARAFDDAGARARAPASAACLMVAPWVGQACTTVASFRRPMPATITSVQARVRDFGLGVGDRLLVRRKSSTCSLAAAS